MSTTDDLTDLQAHAQAPRPASGTPGRTWAADVVTVNPDGTVDAQPVMGRATKVGVLVPDDYAPTVGDRVLVSDLNGDPQAPIVLRALNRSSIPTITGSRGANAALASLLSQLAAAKLIIDNTTS